MRLFLCTGCVVFVAVTARSPARANPAATIVHADKGNLVERSRSGSKKKTLAPLPAHLGDVSRIETSNTGRVLLLIGKARVLRVDLSSKPPAATIVDCEGQASLAPDGRCVACARGKRGVELHRFDSKPRLRRLSVPARRVAIRGATSSDIVALRKGTVWSYRGAKPRRQLAPHAPNGSWLVSPDGTRAAGVYGAKGATPALFAFKLDGKAVKRRLLPSAEPVAWSGDSRWILVQQGTTACIVRGVGGQYKCWKNHRALAITVDGALALLSRTPKDETQPVLYVAELSGARPEPPKKLLAPFSGAVTWRPAAAAATATRPKPAAPR